MVRRDVLKAWLLAAGLAGPTPSGAEARAELSASDVQRIAALFYGADLPQEDASKVALAAGGALSNLKYLGLLKSDDVATPFGYPVALAEAARGS